jgi:hypothetical protein
MKFIVLSPHVAPFHSSSDEARDTKRIKLDEAMTDDDSVSSEDNIVQVDRQ